VIYGSICSGIEAATVAWEPLGWKPAYFSEIEAFPRAVLKHHYPHVPLHGDFTTIEAKQYGAIDLLVGGTPCQDFSVAGLRTGIAGDRGNLTLEFLRLAEREKPRWILWENVPGVLSSDGGRALGAFLGGLAELGYGFAYRVLDAQYFGLAQRRQRVFVVGYLGDWRRAAAVLLEPESLRWDSPPRREAGEKVAPTIGACIGGRDRDFDCNGGLIAGRLGDIAATLQAAVGGNGDAGNGSEMIVAHTLGSHRAGSVTEDGTGRGVPLVLASGQANAEVVRDGSPSLTCLHEAPIVAFSVKDHGADAGPISPTLRAGGHDKSHANGGVMPAVAFAQNQRDEVRLMDVAGALASEPGMKQQTYVHTSAVRRLTPRECERLQGFPDDYTLVPYRGKPAADGPRYKALGNSMAVPCMRWLGERIEMVERLIGKP
jgi:DNA (cytosine-5)-methyltransferase 1